jgi:hypothetical protein
MTVLALPARLSHQGQQAAQAALAALRSIGKFELFTNYNRAGYKKGHKKRYWSVYFGKYSPPPALTQEGGGWEYQLMSFGGENYEKGEEKKKENVKEKGAKT